MEYSYRDVYKFRSFSSHSIFPDEIILKLFGLLSNKDFPSVSRVCKLWGAISEDRSIWKMRLEEIETVYLIVR